MSQQALPVITAETPDTDYLADALRRTGRPPPPTGPVEEQHLDGGRTGAQVSRLHCADGSHFVLKTIRHDRAFREALGHDGEAAAWLAGATRTLPHPLANPVIDVALHPEREEWWLLMDDVSAGIVAREAWTETHTRRLFEAVAELHAVHWNCPEATPDGMATVRETTELLVAIARYAGTGEASTAWVTRAAGEFQVPRMLLPVFLESAGTSNADFYLALLQRWSDLTDTLNAQTPTWLHGDLRRANVAFLDRQVALFDWELTARGPAAVDLTWHWFLQYWAYPPADGHSIEDRLWLRDVYLERLEQALGTPLDHREFQASWDLGWLRVFCQLGFVLADGINGDDGARRVRLIQEAFGQARRLADEHLA